MLSDKISFKKVLRVTDVSFTADDWELYATENGAEAIAVMLNERLKGEVNAGHPKTVVRGNMLRAMELPPYREFGASDTEPRVVLDRALDAIFGE